MDAKMAGYARTARRRTEARLRDREARRVRAWARAEQAAALLREDFGAGRVVAFGSVLRPGRFHERSDVDLAVWGLEELLYLRAVARLLALDPELEFDLVEAEHAAPGLLTVIEREGKDI